MTLAQLIRDEKKAVVEQWYDMVLATYPAQTAKLWKASSDPFSNPVGQTTMRALSELTDHLLVWNDAAAICASLQPLVKIRAVQDFSPSKALAFVFSFKKVVRGLFAKAVAREKLDAELADLDSRVDNLALLATDIYVRAREDLYRMRLDEFKRTHRMLFRKTGIMCETTDVLLTGAQPVADGAVGTE